jgi:hypothetical protein
MVFEVYWMHSARTDSMVVNTDKIRRTAVSISSTATLFHHVAQLVKLGSSVFHYFPEFRELPLHFLRGTLDISQSLVHCAVSIASLPGGILEHASHDVVFVGCLTFCVASVGLDIFRLVLYILYPALEVNNATIYLSYLVFYCPQLVVQKTDLGGPAAVQDFKRYLQPLITLILASLSLAE